MGKHQDTLVVQMRLPGAWGDREALKAYDETKKGLDYQLHDRNVGEVDGGDFGSGTMNIFLLTDSLVRALPVVKAYLRERGLLDRCLIAHREHRTRDDWNYRVIWPEAEENQLLKL